MKKITKFISWTFMDYGTCCLHDDGRTELLEVQLT